ncbi:MAG: methyltransferase domain-containing protein [Planctomycetes bacterium]|nr:methyltransferase domain-containing protein [Planctomycetota bacterium]
MTKRDYKKRRSSNDPSQKPTGRTEPAGSWENIAHWYDSIVGESGSDYHRTILVPKTVELLAPVKGMKVLDVGCGQGVLTRALQAAGCDATGIDLSPSMIALAKKRSSPKIKFVIGDGKRLNDFDDASFDAAVYLMAIAGMDPLADVISSAARVLRPGGSAIAIVTHPCFRIPRQSHWGFEEERKIQYRRIDMYMTEAAIPIFSYRKGFKEGEHTTTYHRPLSAYVSAFAERGFSVAALEEWTSDKKSQPGPLAKAENRARAEIPLFLAIKATLGVKN